MARPFYPFVDNGASSQEGAESVPTGPRPDTPSASVVKYPARIAVYDDAAAAPRVVIVDPTDVRSYLEEITSQVTKLSHDQGGSIPFMVIREVVENFIHAYFIEPTISILDGGDTIRFSDQGPGIKEKERALEYGTSSATEEMKQYIRGVGSGLPYAQQYMVDKGGSLTIEDNISQGTVVTISTHPAGEGRTSPQGGRSGSSGAAMPQVVPPQPSYQERYQPQTSAFPTGAWQGYQQDYPVQPPQPRMPYPEQPYHPYQQPPTQWQQQQPYQQIQAPYQPQPSGANAFSWISISQRGEAILAYLGEHEAVGPTDLAREYGESQPTWTRELKALEEDGLLKKDGQKRRLTRMGSAFLASRQQG